MASPVDSLYWLEYIQPSDRLWVGEKAFYLSQLLQNQYPVLPGFVISAQVFQEFLETIDWLEPLFADLPHSTLHLDVDNPYQLQTISQRIRQAITLAPIPSTHLSFIQAAVQKLQAPTLILRPCLSIQPSPLNPLISNNSQVRGLLESQVCRCEIESLQSALKQVWSHLFGAKSLFYWYRSGLQLQQVKLAILVQPISSAIASGTMQSQDKRLIVRSTWGLGQSLVLGEVTPDQFEIDRQSQQIQARSLGRKLSGYQIQPEPGQPILSSYVLNETEQQEYSLNESHLQSLVGLAQTWAHQTNPLFELEWTLLPGLDATSPQFYLTQLVPLTPLQSYQSSQVLPLSTAAEPSTLLLQGLAAAGGRVIAPAYVVTDPSRIGIDLPESSVLVAPEITPDWLPWFKQVVAIVAERGGMTCHAAIIARELGIPAVVGARQATRILETGALILVDGDRGEVYQGQPATVPPLSSQTLPVVSDSDILPTGTPLLVNLSQTATLEFTRQLPVDGVGLLRSELMVLEILDQQHPKLWIQQGRQQELVQRLVNQIQQFAQAFTPRPVFYRSLDLRSHEFRGLQGADLVPIETNPMLGVRGTLSYRQDPTLFEVELLALKQVQQLGYSNLRLLLPFVRTVEEFVFCRQQVEQIGLTRNSEFQLWIMAEVPSILLLLPDYVQAGVQGISIGTNDLTQLLLGVDRDQPQLAEAFDERHPAVQRAIAQLIQMARQQGIPCSICGQAPARYPDLIESLVRWGISSISVSPDAVEQSRTALYRAEQRLLLETARRKLQK